MSELPQSIPEVIAAWHERNSEPRWQDISTAPKDGTPILVFVRTDEGAEMQQVAVHDGDRLYPWAVSDGSSYHRDLFTHWMPLPPPPRSNHEQQ